MNSYFLHRRHQLSSKSTLTSKVYCSGNYRVLFFKILYKSAKQKSVRPNFVRMKISYGIKFFSNTHHNQKLNASFIAEKVFLSSTISTQIIFFLSLFANEFLFPIIFCFIFNRKTFLLTWFKPFPFTSIHKVEHFYYRFEG